MRLLSASVIKAKTCGKLLDDFRLSLRTSGSSGGKFAPLCLIGPNGAGKSQFLQVLAEMFQSAFNAVVPAEERLEGNSGLEFALEYMIQPAGGSADAHVKISRVSSGRKKGIIVIEQKVDGEWQVCDLTAGETKSLLPTKVVGYTSGDNETLSLPFLLSRSGYADEVAKQALRDSASTHSIADTRLMLIDYGTHLEVLVANLLLSNHTDSLLNHAKLKGIHSFRCVIQLAHSAVKGKGKRKPMSKRKGVQLTQELETHIEALCRCATCFDYEPKSECYTMDFFVDGATSSAFGAFWSSSLELYSALHKLAMLNDLAIPKKTRERFKTDTKARRFASRLPEPQDEDKVFRFVSVNFRAEESDQIVDYVSLSDGEHQFAQLLGTFAMISFPDVLFLLDEPESHFNPKWRVKFISSLLDLPTTQGTRRDTNSVVAQQEALMTTHAPFVPSDMPGDNVLIFSKEEQTRKITVRRPNIETFGTAFDAILDECFGVRPPIAQESRDKIDELRKSENPDEIREGMGQLGYSVEKALLADRLRQLTKKESS